MPSFSDLPGHEGILLFCPTLVSLAEAASDCVPGVCGYLYAPQMLGRGCGHIGQSPSVNIRACLENAVSRPERDRSPVTAPAKAASCPLRAGTARAPLAFSKHALRQDTQEGNSQRLGSPGNSRYD